ncbi:MAG: tetratricopeptide repeat protein [Verrucomicrobiales bacterium]|nr:tetratricopeptide repeat protein [Verrucomicrobiales bacterium]
MRFWKPAEPASARPRACRRIVFVWVAIVVGSAFPGSATPPYTPASDDEVLERIPRGVRSAEVRRRREDLANDPENLKDSVSLARSYLETARVEGDARFLGYAQSILGPWWNQASPPAEVRLARAEVFVSRFEFQRAADELEAVLAAEPGHLEASVALVDVLLARGEVTRAREHLEGIRTRLDPQAGLVMEARIERLSPRLDVSVRDLADSLATNGVAGGGAMPAAERRRALALLADASWQRGAVDAAAIHFEELRRLGGRDVRRLLAEADFELARGRHEAVVESLEGESAHDGLALRLLEAWKRRGETDAGGRERYEELRRQVEKRLEDRRGRGDMSVLPDEVRYWVRIRADAARAVERAEELWSIRRTLDDARIVLEAARLGENPALRDKVAAWSTRLGVNDARLGPSSGGERTSP